MTQEDLTKKNGIGTTPSVDPFSGKEKTLDTLKDVLDVNAMSFFENRLMSFLESGSARFTPGIETEAIAIIHQEGIYQALAKLVQEDSVVAEIRIKFLLELLSIRGVSSASVERLMDLLCKSPAPIAKQLKMKIAYLINKTDIPQYNKIINDMATIMEDKEIFDVVSGYQGDDIDGVIFMFLDIASRIKDVQIMKEVADIIHRGESVFMILSSFQVIVEKLSQYDCIPQLKNLIFAYENIGIPIHILKSLEKIAKEARDGIAVEKAIGARIQMGGKISVSTMFDTASLLEHTMIDSDNPGDIADSLVNELAFVGYETAYLDKNLVQKKKQRNGKDLIILDEPIFGDTFLQYFHTAVMENNKLQKSHTQKRIVYAYLLQCHKNPSFAKVSQKLLVDAGVGKDNLVRIMQFLVLADNVETDLAELVIPDDAEQKTILLKKFLLDKISDTFNANFNTKISEETFLEIERFISPLIDYKIFLGEYPESEDIFINATKTWIDGQFDAYKFTQEFKDEVGEEVFNTWKAERRADIMMSSSGSENATTVIRRIQHALSEVEEHYVDSIFINNDGRLLKALDNPRENVQEEIRQRGTEKNIKDVSAFLSAVKKYAEGWTDLHELMTMAEKSDADISTLRAKIKNFAQKVRPAFSALKVEGAKAQLNVLTGSASTKVTAGGEYEYIESGTFEELFSAGKVMGASPCQAYDFPGDNKIGLTGYIELPWIKVVTARKKGSQAPDESVARVMIKLVKDPQTGGFKIIVEHLYGDARFLPIFKEQLSTAYHVQNIDIECVDDKENEKYHIEFLDSGRSDISYSDEFGGNKDYRGMVLA